MHIRALEELSHAEVAELAEQAADRGEQQEQANPYMRGDWRHRVFADVFSLRAADLAAA